MFSNLRVRLAALATLAAAAGIAVWAHNSSRQDVIQPGSVAFSADDDGIRRLSYRTDRMTLTARRGEAGGKFAVTVEYRDGRPAQHCESAPDLAGLLPGLVEVTARRELKPEKAITEFPEQVGVLELEDEVKGEPIAPFTVRARDDRSAIALTYQDTAFEAAIAPAVFERLEEGCAALAAMESGR